MGDMNSVVTEEPHEVIPHCDPMLGGGEEVVRVEVACVHQGVLKPIQYTCYPFYDLLVKLRVDSVIGIGEHPHGDSQQGEPTDYDDDTGDGEFHHMMTLTP